MREYYELVFVFQFYFILLSLQTSIITHVWCVCVWQLMYWKTNTNIDRCDIREWVSLKILVLFTTTHCETERMCCEYAGKTLLIVTKQRLFLWYQNRCLKFILLNQWTQHLNLRKNSYVCCSVPLTSIYLRFRMIIWWLSPAEIREKAIKIYLFAHVFVGF